MRRTTWGLLTVGAALVAAVWLSTTMTGPDNVPEDGLDPTLTRASAGEVIEAAGREFTALHNGRSYAIQFDDSTFRFEVRESDIYRRDVDGRRRAELREYPTQVRTPGKRFSVSFAVRIERESMDLGPGGWTIVNQVHQNRPRSANASLSRPPALSVGFDAAGRLNIGYRWSRSVGSPRVVSVPVYTSARTMIGEWVRVRYDVTVHPDRGALQVWVDERQVFAERGISVGYPTAGKTEWPKVQFGIYQPYNAAPAVVQFEDFHIAD